jgi:hypothetical protein
MASAECLDIARRIAKINSMKAWLRAHPRFAVDEQAFLQFDDELRELRERQQELGCLKPVKAAPPIDVAFNGFVTEWNDTGVDPEEGIQTGFSILFQHFYFGWGVSVPSISWQFGFGLVSLQSGKEGFGRYTPPPSGLLDLMLPLQVRGLQGLVDFNTNGVIMPPGEPNPIVGKPVDDSGNVALVASFSDTLLGPRHTVWLQLEGKLSPVLR